PHPVASARPVAGARPAGSTDSHLRTDSGSSPASGPSHGTGFGPSPVPGPSQGTDPESSPLPGPDHGTGPAFDPGLAPGRHPDGPGPIDISTGLPDLAAFPRSAWLRAERSVLATATARRLGYGPPQGTLELRTELSAWLARSRGVRARPEEIVVTAGVTG